MKRLCDQNISFKLCRRLADLFPGSEQGRRAGLDRAGDLAIWNQAKADGFVLLLEIPRVSLTRQRHTYILALLLREASRAEDVSRALA